MKNLHILPASAALLSGLILISSCSSEDGGSSSAATLPANAVVIDNTNAEQTIKAAAASTSTLGSALSVQATQVMSLRSVLEIIKPILNNTSTTNVATGATFSEPCADGGSVSGSETITDDGTTYSESGTATFINCAEGGITINGTSTYSNSVNDTTGAYTDNASGSITITFTGGTDTFSFSGFVFSDTGNNLQNTYTIDQLTYAIDFTLNGIQGGGFLVSLLQPIVESDGSGCPESGHLLVNGGNGTSAEGIFNGDNATLTIKANGAVVNSTASCI